MPTFIRLLTPEGLEPVSYSADSLAEAIAYEPDDGVYTVANTFETFKVLKVSAHLDRLEDSAARAGIPLHLDRTRLRAALRDMIAEAGFGSVRYRITVPRRTPDGFILTLEPFKPLSEGFILAGVRVITAPNSARQNAAAKTTGWMFARKSLADAMGEGIYDTILLDENGAMLEALGANFYAILNGELRTAGDNVLPGISRQIVFEVVPGILPLNTTAVSVKDVPHLQEAFISSSSRGIVPVVEIDGHKLGDGRPGPKTLALRNAYNAWVSAHLEEL